MVDKSQRRHHTALNKRPRLAARESCHSSQYHGRQRTPHVTDAAKRAGKVAPVSKCKYAKADNPDSLPKRTASRHRSKTCVCYGVHRITTATGPRQTEHPATADILTGTESHDSNGGEFVGIQTHEAVTDWTHIFKRFNVSTEDFELVNDTVTCKTWQQSKALEDGTRDIVNLYSYGAKFTRRRTTENIDPVAILANLRAVFPFQPTLTSDAKGAPSTFCMSINDIQLGQSYNGGSKATIRQFYRYIDETMDRVLELRELGRSLHDLVIVVGGDLGEGCVIYPNQAFNLDLDRKQQSEGIIALLLHAIDTMAPHFVHVTVLACKGNHGEHRINGKMTTLSDNDDTHAVEMAKLALSRDTNRQHIDWIIAGEEAAVSCPVYDWRLATTHGDVFAKGVSGPTTERKAHLWMKNMSAARKHFGPVADADVLVTHHFHHDEMADWGDTLWRQTRSQDRGSPGFSQATGTYSEPGMLTWVMTPQCRWQDEYTAT